MKSNLQSVFSHLEDVSHLFQAALIVALNLCLLETILRCVDFQILFRRMLKLSKCSVYGDHDVRL